MSQSKLEPNTGVWREARENVWERVTIGFGFNSDYMTKRRENFKLITKGSEAKNANAYCSRQPSENHSI